MKPTLLAGSLLIAIACLGLLGCGQKGDLYRPGHNPNPPRPLMQPAGQSKGASDQTDAPRDADNRDKGRSSADD